jgi:hypothetical protein
VSSERGYNPELHQSWLYNGKLMQDPSFKVMGRQLATDVLRIIHIDGYITTWERTDDEPINHTVHGKSHRGGEHELALTDLELAVKELVMHDNAFLLAKLLLPMSAKRRAKIIERLEL